MLNSPTSGQISGVLWRRCKVQSSLCENIKNKNRGQYFCKANTHSVHKPSNSSDFCLNFRQIRQFYYQMSCLHDFADESDWPIPAISIHRQSTPSTRRTVPRHFNKKKKTENTFGVDGYRKTIWDGLTDCRFICHK